MPPLQRDVGPKCQVVIPKEFRDSLRIAEGTRISMDMQGDAIIIRKAQSRRDAVENFCLVGKGLKRIPLKELKKILEDRFDER